MITKFVVQFWSLIKLLGSCCYENESCKVADLALASFKVERNVVGTTMMV